jgi:hypothetical protein
VLKRLDINSESVVDTLTYDDRGNFSYRYRANQPGYYFLYAGGVKVASLVLMPGDRVKVKASATDRTCNIDGSGESLLYKQADSVFGRSFRTFDSLYVIYKSAPETEKRLSESATGTDVHNTSKRLFVSCTQIPVLL